MYNKNKQRSKAVPSSPYLNARREWNERYGSYISSAKAWKSVAFLSLLIATIAVAGVAYIGSQNKLLPYIVEIDGRGNTVQSYPAERIQDASKRVIKSAIAQFVEDVRSVSSDIDVQRKAIYRAYAFMNPNKPAFVAVNTWLRSNIPFERSKEETVTIEVERVLLISKTTWRVEWLEKPRSRKGQALKPISMTATITVSKDVINAKTIMVNPTGLMIDEFDWSKDLTIN